MNRTQDREATPLERLMWKRGLNIVKLSELTGLGKGTIWRALRGHIVSNKTRDILSRVLSVKENEF